MRIHRIRPGISGPVVALVVLALAAAAGLLAAGSVQAQGSDDAQAAYGRTVYRVYCASCHGMDAEGDGKLAEYLTIKPADLTRINARNDGEFPTERMEKIVDGRESVAGHSSSEMPVWGDAFQKADALEGEPPEVREREVKRKIGALIAYLKSIQAED